jgi:hypothetical protein
MSGSRADQKRQQIGSQNDEKTLQQFVQSLYEYKISDEELIEMYDGIKYIGFDRKVVMSELNSKIGDNKIIIQLILVSAIRGPVKGSDIKLSNGKTPREMGIPASTKGSNRLSLGRIAAATADLAASLLKRLNFPKRLNLECPGWLQFPSAGSITLPSDLRRQHEEFSREFSKRIKGEFNESIYSTMVQNSYYDSSLKLF